MDEAESLCLSREGAGDFRRSVYVSSSYFHGPVAGWGQAGRMVWVHRRLVRPEHEVYLSWGTRVCSLAEFGTRWWRVEEYLRELDERGREWYQDPARNLQMTGYPPQGGVLQTDARLAERMKHQYEEALENLRWIKPCPYAHWPHHRGCGPVEGTIFSVQKDGSDQRENFILEDLQEVAWEYKNREHYPRRPTMIYKMRATPILIHDPCIWENRQKPYEDGSISRCGPTREINLRITGYMEYGI